MSGEKIDLYVVCRSAEMLPKHWRQRANTLALVAAVRAARAWVAAPGCAEAMWATQDALSPFTDTAQGAVQPDSAEVRSDGE